MGHVLAAKAGAIHDDAAFRFRDVLRFIAWVGFLLCVSPPFFLFFSFSFSKDTNFFFQHISF